MRVGRIREPPNVVLGGWEGDFRTGVPGKVRFELAERFGVTGSEQVSASMPSTAKHIILTDATPVSLKMATGELLGDTKNAA